MKTLDKQKKNVLTLCGAAMASLLLWGCGGTNPTAESFERSDYYTRGSGRPEGGFFTFPGTGSFHLPEHCPVAIGFCFLQS